MAVKNIENIKNFHNAAFAADSVSEVPRVCTECDSEVDLTRLLEEVRQIAYNLHVYLGNGMLEKVYENGLKHRLEAAGHKVESQKPLAVYDEDGFELGNYYVDLFVDDCLIIELKAAKSIAAEHVAQTINYLKIMRRKMALLINFGSYRFECKSFIN